MVKTTTDLKEIARAGGGISIDAAGYTTTDIKEIRRAASTSGATIVLRNSNTKTTTDLKEIARTSPGKFIFEL
ncbi:hypothetical protein E4631_24360 [Hymenobacter sp. UV11]|uniref:hypothetical protein n=1 Tax=Hymenobacter sp. UV11 TaxID=1849735 RepID=UPI00105C923F|nr:hypothetical protein [Hymenobacter sp. UV11]TFZ62854.1 hypothetical protein E4631_24360 [Hymenobacter sp. UV11]